MDRSTIVKSIMNDYGDFGVTEGFINAIIDSKRDSGMSYELIYPELYRFMDEIIAEEYVCTVEELANELGVSEEKLLQEIECMISEVIAAGEDPEEYVRYVPSSSLDL